MLEQRRHVGGDEVFSLPKAKHQGAILAHGNELILPVREHHPQGIGAGELLHRGLHRRKGIPVIIVIHKLHHNFRIRIRNKGITLIGKVAF